MPRAFVIRPFGKKSDSKGREIDFEQVHNSLIQPALDAAGLAGSTTGEIVEAGNIREDMFSLILEADLVVADVSIYNPNVFYELGIRHTLRKRCTLLIRDRDAADPSPFDLLTDRFLPYALGSAENIQEMRRRLIEMINASLNAERETDSPVFRLLPGLPEIDLRSVHADFQDDVRRARAARSLGWLRLLAQDVRGRRFEWAGLELVGQTQWDLKDYLGARNTWEAIRQHKPNHVAANLALANIYERLSRDAQPAGAATLLDSSEQAIDVVLAQVTSNQRVEALALRGRNLKTQWKAGFAGCEGLAQRRLAAMNGPLRKSFEAYRDAFREDLNHFWSGLAAMQMANIFLELAKDPGLDWQGAFDDDTQAEGYRNSVERTVTTLRQVVAESVDGALLRMPRSDSNRIWAEVTKADLLFLTEDSSRRVLAKYRDVLTGQPPFVHDAVKGQLQLFASLGVRAKCAEAVLRGLEEPDVKPREAPAPSPGKPLHVVLFAGHRVDQPDRSEARFPESRAEAARKAIAEALAKLSDDHEILGLASGACGADILFHEICAERKIRSVLCLPFRADLYAREEFATLDDWRSRFLALREKCEVRELSDQAALPRWLHGSVVNPWERGNRWVLQMGLTSGARKVSLIALWDNKPEGGARGGTADMVRVAREAGTIDIRILDSAKLV
jgi:hypothetical protein